VSDSLCLHCSLPISKRQLLIRKQKQGWMHNHCQEEAARLFANRTIPVEYLVTGEEMAVTAFMEQK
jgi:hypothetical protein